MKQRRTPFLQTNYLSNELWKALSQFRRFRVWCKSCSWCDALESKHIIVGWEEKETLSLQAPGWKLSQVKQRESQKQSKWKRRRSPRWHEPRLGECTNHHPQLREDARKQTHKVVLGTYHPVTSGAWVEEGNHCPHNPALLSPSSALHAENSPPFSLQTARVAQSGC